jgi:NMD protein affecting ribosome stability and mRNA decay
MSRPRCVECGTPVDRSGTLCSTCWSTRLKVIADRLDEHRHTTRRQEKR